MMTVFVKITSPVIYFFVDNPKFGKYILYTKWHQNDNNAQM